MDPCHGRRDHQPGIPFVQITDCDLDEVAALLGEIRCGGRKQRMAIWSDRLRDFNHVGAISDPRWRVGYGRPSLAWMSDVSTNGSRNPYQIDHIIIFVFSHPAPKLSSP